MSFTLALMPTTKDRRQVNGKVAYERQLCDRSLSKLHNMYSKLSDTSTRFSQNNLNSLLNNSSLKSQTT